MKKFNSGHRLLTPGSCFLSLVLFLLLVAVTVNAQPDYASEVNPFIGTGGHGHTFPGATLPFGMVQLRVLIHASTEAGMAAAVIITAIL